MTTATAQAALDLRVLPFDDPQYADVRPPQRLSVGATAALMQRLGYHVHPLCTPRCGCASRGKVPHLRGWDSLPGDSRALQPDQFDGKNIGVRVDAPLLIVDCDIDTDHPCGPQCSEDCNKNGVHEFTAMLEEHGVEIGWGKQAYPMLITGSGGLHFWFRLPDGAPDLHCNRKLGAHIDTRTEGRNNSGKQAKRGQAVIPPSLHHSGNDYMWLIPETKLPGIDQLPECPPFIIDALRYVEPPPSARPVTEYEHALVEFQHANGSAPKRGEFDRASGAYWEAAINNLQHTGAGEGRNKSVYSLGRLAGRMTNCAEAHGPAHRTMPPVARLYQDVARAAVASGLPEDDLLRQFTNGFEQAEGDMKCPDMIYERYDIGALRQATDQLREHTAAAPQPKMPTWTTTPTAPKSTSSPTRSRHRMPSW